MSSKLSKALTAVLTVTALGASLLFFPGGAHVMVYLGKVDDLTGSGNGIRPSGAVLPRDK